MSGPERDCVVVGAGHNGLIAGCYLAAAGLDVEVVERDTVPGGAVSTVERWPGVRVDRGSSLHVMFRHTAIAAELELASTGLDYIDADPFAVAPDPDRGPLVFATDLAATCASIEAAAGQPDADGYARFVETWRPRWQSLLRLADATNPLQAGRAGWPLARREWRSGLGLPREFLTTAEEAIDRQIGDERLAAAIAWWAAQSGPPPHLVGTAPMAGSIALMHLAPPGRPCGGSGRLSEALVARLAATGGTLRLGDAATAIETDSDRVVAVRTASGDRIPTRRVVAACHAARTFGLLGRPDLSDRLRIGDGIGVAIRLLTDRPPAYDGDTAPSDRGMTLLVRSRQQLRAAAADWLSGNPSVDPPSLVMTPTVSDPTLAPPGRHVVTVWSQWAPARPLGGDWDAQRDAVADRVLADVERWAPGLGDSVVDRLVQTPLDLERELDLVRGDVMHLDMTIDSLFGLRPLPGWGRRTPVGGLYLAGASTHPGGGVWGASGRAAARVVLADLRRRRLRRRLRS